MPQPTTSTTPLTVEAPTADAMRTLGTRIAGLLHGGDVLLLSGPLGAGKTTLAQGIGAGLHADEPVVSPTFTIARELHGRFADGTPATLIHVDAYRLGGNAYAPGQDSVDRLLDELESIGLDEELENPGDNTVILMEWGEQMAAALADERLDIHIGRPLPAVADAESGTDDGADATTETDADADARELTSDGTRTVTLIPVGGTWRERIGSIAGAH
ncbi:tRNA (adenosine(37)-N6)-threonylcarbamoyltransferase complex ATPase subunit type 1 TsaE [Bifidobacterium thermophilum]|uniref:tRNA (adenosine(37)-N6)-threonylcarbamoyltransferase complex ATPase subunit type 1 TsaE n=1 Tax=Bifidobacterium thermophilum TaxID=33905 RepID=UPI0030A75FCC